MPPNPDTPMAPFSAVPRHRRGGARRALTRSWREALIPLGAGDTAAIPLLRAMARRILHGWAIPADLVDDVELSLSELATNALIHTGGPVRVRLAHRAGMVRLDVADTSPHCPATVRSNKTADAQHGRGVGIVAVLADRMRTEPHPAGPDAGKIVIAEFDLD